MANSDWEASRSLAMDRANMRGLLQRRLVIPERNSHALKFTIFNNQLVANSPLTQATMKVDLFPHLPTRKNPLLQNLRRRVVQTRFQGRRSVETSVYSAPSWKTMTLVLFTTVSA